MERAIKDLCRLPDAELFKEASKGLTCVVETVKRLDEAATHLSATDRGHAARIVGNQAQEEAAKALILVDAIRCPRDRSAEKSKTLSYFYDHVAKGIYGEVCEWRPADFAEVIKGIEAERVEHYLDGPDGVNWIFPNRVSQRREDDLYVGYVRDDSEEAGQGYRSWTTPRYHGLLGLLGYSTPNIVRIVSALYAVGATSAAGLAAIADLWRPVQLSAEMSHEDLASLNWRTLEVLEEQNILTSATSDVYATIRNQWPFPLWPLDLTMRKVNKNELRETRRRWTPDI